MHDRLPLPSLLSQVFVAFTMEFDSGGMKAKQIWRPLTRVIEERWEERFGVEDVGRLRESLVLWPYR